MNYLHLQETAKHYANLVEQYRSQLAEEQQINEDLLDLVQALCEELDIDVETLLEDVFDAKGAAASKKRVNTLADIAALKSDSPGGERGRGAGTAMKRWSKADDRHNTRAASKTKFTAKGGRVVKK